MTNLVFLKNDFERAEYLQDILITHATGGKSDDLEYKQLRTHFLSSQNSEHIIPDFIKTKRSLDQFWSFIKTKFGSYAERREFIWDSFSSFLNDLELNKGTSVKRFLSEKDLSKFGANAIHHDIQKALVRIPNDPEGAITLARSILESTCKFICDELEVNYDDNTDLSILYGNVAKELNLSPHEHTEPIFKQILGGCSGIINGLGTLRNQYGDAHGKSLTRIKPSSRHAELAVNLSSTMAIFLIETHEVSEINF